MNPTATIQVSTGWIAHARAGEWAEALVGIGIRLGLALLLFLAGRYLIAWITAATTRGMNRTQMDPTAAMFLSKLASVLMTVVLALASLQVIGVPMTSMIAVLGAAGLAIGLALKDSLSNIASGVMLVTLRPFRVGHVVNINNESGTVEAVSIFQTRLRGADNQTIILPNSLITSESIINFTPDNMRRVELVISIGYTADIDVARDIALRLMHADQRVFADPEPSVLVYALGENSVDLGVRCHTNNADNFATKCELLELIKKAFDKAGVSPPFPQREVNIYQRDGTGRRRAITSMKAKPEANPDRPADP
ncbi:mechanosensitive ion channel family protein [Lysobacter sp. A289]